MACSNYWKIDKIDKLFICLLLIFICLFEFCNNFVFAAEVELSVLNNVVVSNNTGLTSNTNFDTYYFPVTSGSTYVVNYSNIADGRIAFSDSVELGTRVNEFFRIGNVDGQYIFTPEDDGYFFLICSDHTVNPVIKVSISDSYENSIGSLVNNVGIENIWSIFDISVNYIVVVLLFAIGVYIIFSFIKKGSKGKSGF